MQIELHGLALFPPREVSQPLAAIRARFDPEHGRKTVPHITLKQAFVGPAFASEEERALVQRLRAVCARFCALELRLAELESFDSQVFGHVVYAKVESGPALPALAAALVREVERAGFETPHLSVEHETELYMPHLTLAQGLTQAAAQAMLTVLADFEPISFRGERIALGRCTKEGVWSRPFEWRLPPVTASAPEQSRSEPSA